ncbi:hypothetical protein N7462_009896 [Penicillium macrosclerotiorum]|uniref:uncharacterized protein n=1 Tax=Penicillium macrosclerotiorum TaxID=303699 RepID=UPI002548C8DC|nr:uncharacterized protein N7462_009896 [Penicillium macrosclerotiorum]KAJ5668826.1 hypothetical protein N7462_009896 [Penicillium macrosclerotiorum]
MSTTRLTTLWARDFRAAQSQRLQSFTQRASLSSKTSQSLCQATTGRQVASKTLSTSLESTPRSLRSHARSSLTLPSRSYSQGSAVSRLARSATAPGASAETYIAYGMTQKLFEACSTQADYQIPQASQKGVPVPTTESGEHLGVSDSWWYKELGLAPTFSTWSQITFLHMYLLTVRLRALPNRESFQTYSRHLIDHFSHNAEHRMDVLHDLGSRSIRNKYLKDLFIQWRGIIAAYDEGLIKGDAVLGAAVWRNLWKASSAGPDGKEIDWTKVAWVVAYMRRVLAELAKMDEADIVFELGSGKQSRLFGFSAVDQRLAEGSK